MTKKLYKHIGIFVDKVCTGTKKSTKKEGFSALENKVHIHHIRYSRWTRTAGAPPTRIL